MTIAGDLKVMLDALGRPVGDQQVLDALVLVGLPVARDDFQLGSMKRTYYTAEDKMADFVFEDGILNAVMIKTVPGKTHGAYPTPDTLIEGLSGTAARAEVRERFGDPDWSNASADRFPVDGKYLHVTYKDDHAVKISVMHSLPGQK